MIYGLFAWIDWVIYKIAATLFRVIFEIAETDFFTKTQIADVAKRVYLILGVLILFEVVISAVQFLVNPDKFEDKDKGFFGLLQKTVITIVLIVVVPVVFDFALSIQGAVIKAIPAIIFGTEASQNVDKEHIGEELSFTVLSSFVQARQGKNGSIGSDPKNEIHDIDTFTAHVGDGCPLFLVTIIGGNCEYNYLVLASSLAGGFLVYVLMSMALDVAIRTIKLGIIQILSPIPISSYIFGKEKFNKFVKMSLQVYADLFIRMAIVYLIIFTFKSLLENGILNVAAINGGVADTGSWLMNVIVNIMIIFGLLMFAKSAPKFLSDLLGLPEITGGDMADMFKPAWQRAGGAALQAINPIRTAAAAGLNSWQQSDNLRGHFLRRTRRVLRTAAAAGRGAFQGGIDSVQGAMAGDDFAKMRQRQKQRDEAAFHRAYRSHYYRTQSFGEAMKQRGQSFTAGAMDFIGQTTVNSQGYTSAASAIDTVRNEAFVGRAKGEVMKAPGMFQDLTASLAAAHLTAQFKFTDADSPTTPRGILTSFSYTDVSGRTFNNVDYNKLYTLFSKVEAGTATSADYAAFNAGRLATEQITPGDVGKVKELHENINKKANAEYVRIAMQADKMLNTPSIRATLNDLQVKQLEKMADSEVIERVKRFEEAIGALNIPAKEKAAMREKMAVDIGDFLAKANKTSQAFKTEADRRKNMEQAQGGGNSGGK